jgi:hypothetical protein
MFQKAVAAGKRVFLTSDMYLPSKFLGDLLESLGIRGYEQILVSCEEGSMKQDYLLERLLSLGCGADKIIHIGDSWEHDVVPADTLGIRWVHIPTVQEIAQAHGFEPAIELANTLPERLLLGSCLACAFQDPFARRSYEPDECRFARLSMAPVVIGFMSWLFRKVQEETETLYASPEEKKAKKAPEPEEEVFEEPVGPEPHPADAAEKYRVAYHRARSNLGVALVVALLPNGLRGWIFKKLLHR